MGSTVAVGSLEISSNHESAEDMSKALTPIKEGKAPRVLVDAGKTVEPALSKGFEERLSKAASELGKAGGRASAEARREARQDEAPEPEPVEAKSDEQPAPEKVEERPGHRRDDARTRIAQLVQEREEARREAAEVRARLEAVEAGKRPEAAPKSQPDDDRPTPDRYETYEEYVEALTDYKVEQRARKFAEETEARGRAESASQETARIKAEFHERTQKELAAEPGLMDRIDPELTVALETWSPGKPLTPQALIGTEVARCQEPLKLLAYMSEHPDEVRAIVQLRTPQEMVLGVSRLYAKVSGLPPSVPRKASNAPEPFKPLQPSSVPGDPDITGDIDFDTFAARVKARRR